MLNWISRVEASVLIGNRLAIILSLFDHVRTIRMQQVQDLRLGIRCPYRDLYKPFNIHPKVQTGRCLLGIWVGR